MADTEPVGGRRHELHEAEGALTGDGKGIVVTFDFDDGVYQKRIEIVLFGGLLDHFPQIGNRRRGGFVGAMRGNETG